MGLDFQIGYLPDEEEIISVTLQEMYATESTIRG